MSLKFGKRELTQIAEVLDQDHATVDDAALALLKTFELLFQQRAKFTVVGQLTHSATHGDLGPHDDRAIKLALGWYSTEGEARSAAESLWTSTRSGDTFRCWVLNVHHGTAADLHAERKAHYVELEKKQAEAARERMRASIEKRNQEMNQIAQQLREGTAA